MKKSLLVLFLTFLAHASMAQGSQPWLEKKISISIQNKPVEVVLKSLEKDLSGMAFAYLPGSFDMAKKVTVKLDSVPLKEVLQEIFAEQGMECTEMRGKIFLKKKKQEPKSGNGSGSKRRRRVTSGGSGAGNASVAVREEATVTKPRTDTTTATEAQNPPDWITQLPPLQTVSSQSVTENNPSTTLNSEPRAVDEEALDSASQPVIEPSIVPELLQVKWQGNVLSPQTAISRPYIPPIPIYYTDELERASFWSWFKMPAFLKKNPDKPARDKKVGVSVNSDDELTKKGLSFYLATSVGVSPLGEENGVKIGGRVVWQKSPSLGLGVGGYGIVGSSRPIEGRNERYRIAGGYGGLHMEYTLNLKSPVHLTFPILVALGEVTYVNATTALPLPDITEDGTQIIMVLEPGAMLEMNIFSFMKLGLNMTYRYTTNSELKFSDDTQLLSSSDMNGISAAITIKIGRF